MVYVATDGEITTLDNVKSKSDGVSVMRGPDRFRKAPTKYT